MINFLSLILSVFHILNIYILYFPILYYLSKDSKFFHLLQGFLTCCHFAYSFSFSPSFSPLLKNFNFSSSLLYFFSSISSNDSLRAHSLLVFEMIVYYMEENKKLLKLTLHFMNLILEGKQAGNNATLI